MAMGRKAVDLVPLSADDIQTLGADRAGRTQQRNFFDIIVSSLYQA